MPSNMVVQMLKLTQIEPRVTNIMEEVSSVTRNVSAS
jgi:hypothetical protein